jgi:hypothetical protein
MMVFKGFQSRDQAFRPFCELNSRILKLLDSIRDFLVFIAVSTPQYEGAVSEHQENMFIKMIKSQEKNVVSKQNDQSFEVEDLFKESLTLNSIKNQKLEQPPKAPLSYIKKSDLISGFPSQLRPFVVPSEYPTYYKNSNSFFIDQPYLTLKDALEPKKHKPCTFPNVDIESLLPWIFQCD